MTISDEQLREWAAEAKEAYQSALWECCPEEFWLLLNEVARLKAELQRPIGPCSSDMTEEEKQAYVDTLYWGRGDFG